MAEGAVLLEFAFEDAGYTFGEIGDLIGELGDGVFPIDLVRLLVLEEELEDFDELFRRGDGFVEDDLAALVEDGVAGRLEEDVGEGLAGVAFALDLFGEVVVGVLGFPEAVDEGEVVDEGAVGAERFLATPATKTCRRGPRFLFMPLKLVLLDEVPAVGGATAFEEVGEGGAGVAFGGVAVFGEGGEGFEVSFDGLVGGFYGKKLMRFAPEYNLLRTAVYRSPDPANRRMHHGCRRRGCASAALAADRSRAPPVC